MGIRASHILVKATKQREAHLTNDDDNVCFVLRLGWGAFPLPWARSVVSVVSRPPPTH
jgi:hypothetical protein